MKQITAVEFLIEQVKSKEWQDMFIWHKEEVFEHAKQMEKQQIIDAANHGANYESSPFKDAEDYYKQTYEQ